MTQNVTEAYQQDLLKYSSIAELHHVDAAPDPALSTIS
jgi:hypothetical protein